MGFPLDWLTPCAWVGWVEREPLALLADHAHCELKAATTAQALIAKNPEQRLLVRELGEVAIEEMQHFVRVVGELYARGGELGAQDENPYAARLHAASTPTRTSLFLDRLVIAHLIEARSLERFHLLAHHLSDPALRDLYRELLPSEAAHQGLYVRLAREAFPADVVLRRIAELRAREGEVIAGLAFEHRVHSGIVGAPSIPPLDAPAGVQG
ncbi:MAG: tRNA isopentenyl-2-thiomethyl-A-37 hydroxylase MiaE [Planctomycetota bacterium]